MKRRSVIITLLGSLASCSPDSQPIRYESGVSASEYEHVIEETDTRITVSLSRTSLTVGDIVRLEVRVDTTPAVIVRFPEQVDQLGDWSVIRREIIPGIPIADLRRWVFREEILSFNSGSLEVPSRELTLQYQDTSETRIVRLPVIDTVVSSIIPQDLDPMSYRDIVGELDILPEHSSQNHFREWIIIGVTLLICGSAFAIAWYWFVRSKQLTSRSLHPWEWAEEQLRQLEHDRLLDVENYRQYHVRLTDILRQYVEYCFGITAPELTTHEFLRQIDSESRLNDLQRSLLTSFLKQQDMIKFALRPTSRQESNHAIQTVRSFIESSKTIHQSDGTDDHQQ